METKVVSNYKYNSLFSQYFSYISGNNKRDSNKGVMDLVHRIEVYFNSIGLSGYNIIPLKSIISLYNIGTNLKEFNGFPDTIRSIGSGFGNSIGGIQFKYEYNKDELPKYLSDRYLRKGKLYNPDIVSHDFWASYTKEEWCTKFCTEEQWSLIDQLLYR